MIVIENRNVNNMFVEGLHTLAKMGERSDSRAGPVVVLPCPVMSVYERPTERVLFNMSRDANPFFHLMESLWMLAGRNDSAMLDKYVPNFGERFSDKGHIHGAYGHRWRSHFGFDQLDAIVRRLLSSPSDRQCVLQMWDATPRGAEDLTGEWKDRPCNTHVYFRVRDVDASPLAINKALDSGVCLDVARRRTEQVLDMTICCRSNDMVWGAYGANAVHFSVLMEYVAGRVGVQVGKMYQLSNNFHGYVDVLDKLGEPSGLVEYDPYESGAVCSMSMGTSWARWDEDLATFMHWHDVMYRNQGFGPQRDYVNEWFATVAEPVAAARWNWMNGFKPSARTKAKSIEALDWQVACVEWMNRRMK